MLVFQWKKSIVYLLTLIISIISFKVSKYLKKNGITLKSTCSIWDQVLDENKCSIVDHIMRFDNNHHMLFSRQSENNNLTGVEFLIDSILHDLSDNSSFVEYWWRDEWMNLEAHRDIDELLFRCNDSSILRFPNFGHVLYLYAGDDVQSGSTIIFHENINNESSNENLVNCHSRKVNKLSVVPAKVGRLLRFTGDSLHSVPRPSLAYLDEAEGGFNYQLWIRQRKTPSDPDYFKQKRSVLLFNTWSEPPLLEQKPMNNEGKFPIHSNPKQNWKFVEISEAAFDEANDRLIRLKIGLLGTTRRRPRKNHFMELRVSSDIKSILCDSSISPRCFSAIEYH